MSINQKKILTIFFISIFIIFAIFSSIAVFSYNRAVIYAENSVIENLQALSLICSALIFLIASLVPSNKARVTLLFFTLLCYGFFLRELDIERMDLPSIFHTIGSGKGRNLSIFIALVSLSIYAITTNYKSHVRDAHLFIKSTPGIFIILAGGVLVFSSLFEKKLTFTHHVFIEELLELLGYTMILISSIYSLNLTKILTGKGKKKSGPIKNQEHEW